MVDKLNKEQLGIIERIDKSAERFDKNPFQNLRGRFEGNSSFSANIFHLFRLRQNFEFRPFFSWSNRHCGMLFSLSGRDNKGWHSGNSQRSVPGSPISGNDTLPDHEACDLASIFEDNRSTSCQ